MSRPVTPRSEHRSTPTAQEVQSWFGASAASPSHETTNLFIKAAAFFNEPFDHPDAEAHQERLRQKQELAKAKKLARDLDTTMSKLLLSLAGEIEKGKINPFFRKHFAEAFSAASNARAHLSGCDFEVYGIDPEWPDFAMEVMPLVSKALQEAGLEAEATSENSVRVRVFGGFLKCIGFDLTAGQIRKQLLKNQD